MLTCTFEDGHQFFFRHVVTGNIVIDHDQILLIKRSASAITCPFKWGLPGGYVDRDETVSQAALREVHEETGYRGEIIQLFMINDFPKRKQEDKQNIEFVYLVKVTEKDSQPDHEILETRWFPLNSLPKDTDFAFDHLEEIQRYLEYLKTPTPLPILRFEY